MKPAKTLLAAASACVIFALAHTASSQLTRFGSAKGFTLPDYYPSSNGVQKLRTVLTGNEAQPVSNGLFLLKQPRIENYRPDGALEWVAVAETALVSLFNRSASGTNHVVFQTADTNVVVKARGFLWQAGEGVLIVSNQTTWIDRALFTNGPMLP